MDVKQHLILIKKEDQTQKVESISLNRKINKMEVVFANSRKPYSYDRNNVQWFKNPSPFESPKGCCVYHGVKKLELDNEILDFGEYIKVMTSEREDSQIYKKSKLSFSSEIQPAAKIFSYLTELAQFVKKQPRDEEEAKENDPAEVDKESFLGKQYTGFSKNTSGSILDNYLRGIVPQNRSWDYPPVYPFGCNISQKKAVKAALHNNISVVEGPPGTGKTQTILNIIANVIMAGKTVAVVAGNNSATQNVQEKLIKRQYGFLTALLGNNKNCEDYFAQNGKKEIVLSPQWNLEAKEFGKYQRLLVKISTEVESLLEKQNRLALIQTGLQALKTEHEHFVKETGFVAKDYALLRKIFSEKWSSKKILRFLAEIELSAWDRSWLAKLLFRCRYRLFHWQDFAENEHHLLADLNERFYRRKTEELQQECEQLSAELRRANFQKLLNDLADISEKLFRHELYGKRKAFNYADFSSQNYLKKFNDFVTACPVILSTTHSLSKCSGRDYLYDYLIIDEASQVDLLSACLALSCCRNVVIIGDCQQLPHIVPTEIGEISDELLQKYDLPTAYDYRQHSILSSFHALYEKSLPKVLLKEHYRCHPKIIGFCNQKFYDDKLVIMTGENSSQPFEIHYTVEGHHVRKDINNKPFNQRQLEVVRDEIIKLMPPQSHAEVGVISPYRGQANKMQTDFKATLSSQLEVDTIHRFQGREKSTIIFTTVEERITRFMDNANLVNVAVSRAKERFVIVMPKHMAKRHGTNIGDLIRYIEYHSINNPEVAVNSRIISVFDLLYREYAAQLIPLARRLKRDWDIPSEEIANMVIGDVLAENKRFSCFKAAPHVPLFRIIKDLETLDDVERKFVTNPNSHVDFLIFNKADKTPVLAIEVDGVQYHQNNPQQLARDRIKDKVLAERNIAVLRLPTNGSDEKRRMIRKLDAIISSGWNGNND